MPTASLKVLTADCAFGVVTIQSIQRELQTLGLS